MLHPNQTLDEICIGFKELLSGNSLDITNKNLYYVYVVRCAISSQFYFGYTQCIKKRRYQHLSSIRDYVIGKERSNIQEVHRYMASTFLKISNRRKKPFDLFGMIKENVKVEPIGVCANLHAALAMEWGFILLYKNWSTCLNAATKKPVVLRVKRKRYSQ